MLDLVGVDYFALEPYENITLNITLMGAGTLYTGFKVI